jgi:hypothetical protein
MDNNVMKKSQTNSDNSKTKRPPRAKLTEEEVLKRMEEFPKRKERFLATARAGKS